MLSLEPHSNTQIYKEALIGQICEIYFLILVLKNEIFFIARFDEWNIL